MCRRRIVSAFLAIAVLFVFSYFLHVYDTDSPPYHEHQGAVVMSIAPGTTISKERVTIRLTNNTDLNFVHDTAYSLLARTNIGWRMVQFNGVLGSLVFSLPPNSYVDIEKDLLWSFGYLPDGEYRIIRNIYYNTNHFRPELSRFQVMVEFEL